MRRDEAETREEFWGRESNVCEGPGAQEKESERNQEVGVKMAKGPRHLPYFLLKSHWNDSKERPQNYSSSLDIEVCAREIGLRR